jgi:hypothetical protein
MKPVRCIVTPALASMLLCLPGCGNSDADTPSPTQDVTIPTQDEADAAAAEEITSENADEVFDQLSEEIDAETEGDQ